jgi:hypothetical protein
VQIVRGSEMVDNFALAVSHGLLTILAFRLMFRDDLEADLPVQDDQQDATPAPPPKEGFARRA